MQLGHIGILAFLLCGCQVAENVREVGTSYASKAVSKFKDVGGKASELELFPNRDKEIISSVVTEKIGFNAWEVGQVKSLDLSGRGIRNINFLREFSAIKALDLSENSINELEPLLSLKGLSVLIVNGNEGLTLETINAFRLGNPECLVVHDPHGAELFGGQQKPLGLQWRVGGRRIIRGVISQKLMKPVDELTYADLYRIHSIDLSNTDIGSLSGIEELPRLKAIDITGCSINSLKPLSGSEIKVVIALDNDGLSKEELELFLKEDKNRTLIHPMFGETLVSGLRIPPPNNFSEILSLEDSEVMLKLLGISSKLDENYIITELRKVTSLESPSRGLRDIRLISFMPNLEYIDLEENMVTDISPLSACLKVSVLYLRGNRINSIKPLLNLPKLTRIWIDGEDDFPEKDVRVLEAVLRRNGGF